MAALARGGRGMIAGDTVGTRSKCAFCVVPGEGFPACQGVVRVTEGEVTAAAGHK